MSESLRLADDAWDDAETLVDRIEMLCQQDVPFEKFNQELIQGIARTTRAITASLWEVDDAQTKLLARQGIDMGDSPTASDPIGTSAQDCAPANHWTNLATLVCRQATMTANSIRLETSTDQPSSSGLILHLRFEQPVPPSFKRPAEELCGAALSIASLAWLRHRHRELRQDILDQQTRDRTVGLLHSGSTFIESLSSIVTTVAQHTGADRVSILEVNNGTCRLTASSVATRIDHRSRHVTRMQDLVGKVIHDTSALTYVVGRGCDIDAGISESLESYIDESGSREIRIETVTASATENTPIAAIVLERFRLPEPKFGCSDDLDARFRTLKRVTADATRLAFRRDRDAWQSLLSRWVRGNTKRNTLIGACAVSALVAVLAFLPVAFTIPAEGRLVPNQHISLFAPHDATVESISVLSGQRVKAGDKLMVLSSSSLDLQEKTLAGELATVQSQLAAVQASKSGGGRNSSPRKATSRSDQRVLETMVASLRKRLTLVETQQRRLTVQSPIDGIAQQLDMQQSLLSRPIARGQRLINVVAPEAGWTAELDVPDAELGYITDTHQTSQAPCHFRLRSDPTHIYQGHIERIEKSSHLSPDGKSVVRVTIIPAASVLTTDQDNFRVGATVMASVHCGHRPVGFVWFRSLIEWVRCQSWI